MPLATLSIDITANTAQLIGDSGKAARAVENDTDRMARGYRKWSTEVRDATRLTRREILALNYTASDIVASLSSGVSPMTILLQQGPQVRDAFGGVAPVFSKIAGALTVAHVAAGGLAAGIVGVGYAFYEGSRQSREFNDALILSGNAAGQTEGQVTALARSIAAGGQVTAGAAREAAQALLATGEVGPQVFGAAARAAALYAQATKKTAAEVASDFAAMGRDVSKWTLEHNRSLNFVTAAQYLQIKSLQETGRAAEAQGIVYDALTQRLGALDGNLGTLDRILRTTKNAWSSFWDSAYDIGRAENIESKVARAAATVARLQAPGVTETAGGAALVAAASGRRRGTVARDVDAAQGELTADLRRLFRERENADAGAIKAQTEAAGIAAREFGDKALEAAKSVIGLNKALADNALAFKNAAAAGVPFTDKEQKAIDEATRKKFAPAKGPKNNEPEQVRKAERDAALQVIEEGLQRERAAYAFQNAYLNAIYQTGTISLKDFYAERLEASERDEQATAEGFARRIRELEKYRDATKDPSEKLKAQTDIDKTQAQADASALEAQRRRILTVQQETEERKRLTDSVVEYRAQLLQLQGDEAGAARLRTEQAIKAAQELAKRSGGAFDASAYERELEALKAVNEARRQIGLTNDRLTLSEDRIALLREKGTVGELDALALQGQARQRVVAALEAQLAAMQKVYDESATKNPQLLLDIERARLEIDKLTASLDPLKEKFDNLLKGAGEGFFETLLGGKGLRAALQSFTSTVTQELNRITAKELSRQVFGEGGILGGAGGFLAGAFGGKGGESAAQTAATAAITAAQASSAAAIATANATAHAATTTAIVTAIGASTTAIVSAIGASAATDSAGGFLNDLGGLEVLGSLGFARGGVFGAQPFASGGIFNSPTFFRFADGGTVNRLGVMGEAGPEAVMPLRRGPDGKLGVAAGGGRGAGGMTVNAPITITINVPPGTTRETMDQAAAKVGRQVRAALARGTA